MWRWSLLILLQVVESLNHGLHQLGLHSQHLFQLRGIDVDVVRIMRLRAFTIGGVGTITIAVSCVPHHLTVEKTD